MAINFRYQLSSAPEPRSDGSGCIDHDIWAQYQVDDGEWLPVPGRHKTISIPAAELESALNQSTNPQKVAVYKTALANNLDNQPEPVTGWSNAQLLALVEANAEADTIALVADVFIQIDLGQNYPVGFNI